MTNYKPYESYAIINKGWLGSIPNGWDNASLKWISSRYSGGTPDKNNPEYWQDGEIPWLNSGEVNQEVITKPSTYISMEGFKNSSAKWIPVDGLLMALAGQGKTKGMVAQTKIRTTCNQSMAAIVINKGLPKFFYWWLNSQYKNIRGLTSDEGRDGLNLEMVGSIICPIPTKDEQEKISNFLDYKTAQIDALIAKKETLLLKLQEKRSALITQAVTKGINPNVPMRPSGVEWLGDVPAHWKIKRLKNVASYNDESLDENTELDYEIQYVDIASVSLLDGITNVEKLTFEKAPSRARRIVRENDIIISTVRTYLKAIASIDSPPENMIVSTGFAVIRPHKFMNPRYMHFQLTSDGFVGSVVSNSVGVSYPAINASDLVRIYIVEPPLSEQEKIAEHLTAKIRNLDEQKIKINRVIEKLREYRSVLITNAVTGKIDVRDFDLNKTIS